MKRKGKKPATSEADSEGQRGTMRVDEDIDVGGGAEGSGITEGEGNKFDQVILLLKGYLSRLAATEEEGTRQLIDEGRFAKKNHFDE